MKLYSAKKQFGNSAKISLGSELLTAADILQLHWSSADFCFSLEPTFTTLNKKTKWFRKISSESATKKPLSQKANRQYLNLCNSSWYL